MKKIARADHFIIIILIIIIIIIIIIIPKKAAKYFLVSLTRPWLVPFRQKIIVSVSVQDKTPCDQDQFWIEDKLDCNPR